MDQTISSRYEYWKTSAVFDDATRAEVAALEGNEEEISDRFYRELEFGTGGLRGVIGAGTNRMNRYTVGKATQGLANYIRKMGGEKKGVAIAYDSRHMSVEFSDCAARVLAANGIRAYRFESLRPTPELSFAVRELGCIAGINITASHNPPEYNGYKVYWEDGGQIVAPHDRSIIAEVNAIADYADVRSMEAAEAKERGLYVTVGEEIDRLYLDALKKNVLHPEAIREMASSLKIVYTPLHGTGNLPVRRLLAELGFEHVTVVPEQELPDGDFPTVSYPNPEDPRAFDLALALARETDADLVLATDPDADRLGVYAKDSATGAWMPFTGNMSGILIGEYELSERRALGLLPDNGALVTTIVSSNMAKALAKEYGVSLIETLTGFKYIGEQILRFEKDRSHEFLFGFEESYGCLVGTHARDKDAVVAVMALCEAAAFYKKQGLTLWDQMLRIYGKYGYYAEGQFSRTFKGAEGAETMRSMMDTLRADPPASLGGYAVEEFRDYSAGLGRNCLTGEEYALTLPKSNVLYFALEGNAWVCVRPSGTEPKIKYYAGVCEDSIADARERLGKLLDAFRG